MSRQFRLVDPNEIAGRTGNANRTEFIALLSPAIESIDLIASALQQAREPKSGLSGNADNEDLHVRPRQNVTSLRQVFGRADWILALLKLFDEDRLDVA